MSWAVIVFAFFALLLVGGLTTFYGLVASGKTPSDRIVTVLIGVVIIAVTGYAGYHLFDMLPK